jgi:D-lactate dehydrogenase (cytochrome)
LGNVIETVRPRPGSGAAATVVDSRERIEESYGDYLQDESRYGPASADRLVIVRDEAQVSEALVAAAGAGEDITVSAGRTGIVGGAVPVGGTLLSLADMKRVLGVRRLPDGRFTIRVEPGLTVAELRELLTAKDLGIEEAGDDAGARADLEAFLSDGRQFFYPPDPTEDTAHLGATVATNASGARSYRYGATRRHVHGLRAALTTGDVVAVERGGCFADGLLFELTGTDGSTTEVRVPEYDMPGTKNAAGYHAAPGMDLIDLFIGSEGTLGVITEVELVLTPAPEGVLSALAFFGSDEDAIAFVRHARGDGPDGGFDAPVTPLALEFFDARSFEFLRRRKAEEGPSSSIPELPAAAVAGVLFETEFTEDALLDVYEAWESVLSAHGSSMDDTWGGMEEAELARLRTLRHSIAEQVNGVIARANARHPEIHKIGTDAAVPPGALEDMFGFYRRELDGTGLEHVIFGHIGDNHLHLNIMPSSREELLVGKELAMRFARRAVELGGAVSAEHGIGRMKHDLLRLQYGDEGMKQMARVKRAFDPSCVLNRGVVFPGELLR